jgi:hypothetical protein
MTAAEIWNIVVGAVTAFASLFIILELVQMKKQTKINFMQLQQMQEQTKLDADKLKREKTVDVMIEWAKSLEKETSFAEKIVKNFSKEQCKSLYNFQDFEVTGKELCEKLCIICPDKDNVRCLKCKQNLELSNKITIEGYHIFILRWLIIKYLNSLEVIMIAWQQGIVDSDIIEQEFAFLVNDGEGELKNFRQIAGGGASYPIIETFCDKLIEKNKHKTTAKLKNDINVTKELSLSK